MIKTNKNIEHEITISDTIKIVVGYVIFWFISAPFYSMVDKLMGDHVWATAVNILLYIGNRSSIGPLILGEILVAVCLAVLSLVLFRVLFIAFIRMKKYDLAILYSILMVLITLFRADVVWEYYLTASVIALALYVLRASIRIKCHFLTVLLLVAI